jgi:hypothetical protein
MIPRVATHVVYLGQDARLLAYSDGEFELGAILAFCKTGKTAGCSRTAANRKVKNMIEASLAPRWDARVAGHFMEEDFIDFTLNKQGPLRNLSECEAIICKAREYLDGKPPLLKDFPSRKALKMLLAEIGTLAGIQELESISPMVADASENPVVPRSDITEPTIECTEDLTDLFDEEDISNLLELDVAALELLECPDGMDEVEWWNGMI